MFPESGVEAVDGLEEAGCDFQSASDAGGAVGADGGGSCLPCRSRIMSRVFRDCASIVGLFRFGGRVSVAGEG